MMMRMTEEKEVNVVLFQRIKVETKELIILVKTYLFQVGLNFSIASLALEQILHKSEMVRHILIPVCL